MPYLRVSAALAKLRLFAGAARGGGGRGAGDVAGGCLPDVGLRAGVAYGRAGRRNLANS